MKLTLRPGQFLKVEFQHATDDGWHWEGHSWEYDTFDGVVRSIVATEGCDCDGRLDRYWVGDAKEYDDEFVDQDDGQAYRRLRYETKSRSQRDHAAEAMGY